MKEEAPAAGANVIAVIKKLNGTDALGHIGPDAQPAAPALSDAAQDQSIRREVEEALQRIVRRG